jgi:hypothetical protein
MLLHVDTLSANEITIVYLRKSADKAACMRMVGYVCYKSAPFNTPTTSVHAHSFATLK